MVTGGDSCSKDCGFESLHHILDGQFFTFICCKNCNVCLIRKNPKKRQVVAHFLKKYFKNVYLLLCAFILIWLVLKMDQTFCLFTFFSLDYFIINLTITDNA